MKPGDLVETELGVKGRVTGIEEGRIVIVWGNRRPVAITLDQAKRYGVRVCNKEK